MNEHDVVIATYLSCSFFGSLPRSLSQNLSLVKLKYLMITVWLCFSGRLISSAYNISNNRKCIAVQNYCYTYAVCKPSQWLEAVLTVLDNHHT